MTCWSLVPGRRVGVIERKAVVGGVCINIGTIPSKTLHKTVLHLSGYRKRGVYGSSDWVICVA